MLFPYIYSLVVYMLWKVYENFIARNNNFMVFLFVIYSVSEYLGACIYTLCSPSFRRCMCELLKCTHFTAKDVRRLVRCLSFCAFDLLGFERIYAFNDPLRAYRSCFALSHTQRQFHAPFAGKRGWLFLLCLSRAQQKPHQNALFSSNIFPAWTSVNLPLQFSHAKFIFFFSSLKILARN